MTPWDGRAVNGVVGKACSGEVRPRDHSGGRHLAVSRNRLLVAEAVAQDTPCAARHVRNDCPDRPALAT
jgi:hypothetical protein